MPKAPRKAKVDPELRRQLKDATAESAAVQAVFKLRSAIEARPPAEVQKEAQELLDRVSAKTGKSPERVNILKNLGMFALEAPADYIDGVLEEEGVESAVANQAAASKKEK